MRSKSVWALFLASLTLFLVALRAAPTRAEPSKEKEVSSDGLRKQFQWEEKVMGPKVRLCCPPFRRYPRCGSCSIPSLA